MEEETLHVQCRCGCEVFYQAQAVKIDENDFRIWRADVALVVNVVTIPILVCLQCGRIKTPSVTLAGKNRTDPEVIAYGEVLNAVARRNGGIDDVEASGLNRLASNRIVG